MTLLILLRPSHESSTTPVTVDPGGGGMGAVMSQEFFERYEPRYAPVFKARYKTTLRKQKP